MTRQELAEQLARSLGDPAFAERVTSSWGTFLKPAAGRGYLAFGPDRGRNVTFVHPGAWLGIDIPEPDEAGIDPLIVRHLHAFPGATKGELARWWGVTAGKPTKPLKRLERPPRARRPRGQQGLRARRGPRELRRTRPVPPSTSASSAASTRTRCRSRRRRSRCCRSPGARSSRGPPAGSARSLLSGGAVAGTWTHETEAEGDDDRAQPVAPPDEGRASPRRGGGRGDRRVPRARRRGPPPVERPELSACYSAAM